MATSRKRATPTEKPVPPESPAARAAYEDYWQLGPGRSMKILREHYLAQKARGVSVPTVRLDTLGTWSSNYGWIDRCIARQDQQAQAIVQASIEEHQKLQSERLRDAQSTRRLGGHVVQHCYQLIKRGALDKMTLCGYYEEPTAAEKASGARAKRYDGLFQHLPVILKCLQVGHELENKELQRELDKFQRFVDEFIAGLPASEAAGARSIAARLAAED